MDVYVLTYSTANDCESDYGVIGVYGTLDKAKEMLKEKAEEAKICYEDYDEEDLTIDDDDTSFAIYVDGEYLVDHISYYIVEKKLK